MKTAAQVREMLRASAPGITFRREESGDYRVTFTQAAIAAAFPGLSRAELIAKAESLAAYESDADSVLETGLAMARTGLRDFGAELAARREMEAAALDPAAAPAEPEAAPVRETIRLEMNWSAAAGIIAAALENGTGEGKRAARAELARMAELADERNRLARATAAALEALDSNQSPHARLAAIRAALSI